MPPDELLDGAAQQHACCTVALADHAIVIHDQYDLVLGRVGVIVALGLPTITRMVLQQILGLELEVGFNSEFF